MAAAWQEAGSEAGAQLQCSQAQTEPCQEPQCGTHHGPKPHGVRAAREGFGCGASGQCPLPATQDSMVCGLWAESPPAKEKDVLSRFIPCWHSS